MVSPHVLKIRGVSGVGLPDGRLTVYLAEDTPAVREAVEAVLRSYAPGIAHGFATTGSFKILSDWASSHYYGNKLTR